MLILLLLLLWPVTLAAQGSAPIFIGQGITVLPPAVDAAGQKVVFGSAITPDGASLNTADLYVVMADGSGLRRLTQLPATSQRPAGANAVSLASDASRAAFTAFALASGSQSEEVHVVDVAAGTDRTVVVDKEGCIQPAVGCPICFFACLATPHLSPTGGKVLYAARRQQPFYIVNADGSGLSRLPIYNGVLAPAPQRVITRSGLVVFTSSAPSGPTTIASAWDVYLMNLDGTGIQNVTKFGNNASLFTSNATISADGSTIAFESNRNPDTGAPDQVSRVWVVRSDGTGLRALTAGSPATNNPSISADGSTIAFIQNGQIYLVRSDGSGLKALTNFQMSAALDPVISDDGSRVVFTIGPQNGSRGAIYAANSDGTNLHALYAPRALNPYGISSAAGSAAPSPASLITGYGLNLAPDGVTAAPSFPLPNSLAGLSLLVNGSPVPLVSVTPWQANAQLPPDTPAGAAAFQLRFSDGAMPPPSAADVQSFAPAIFYSLQGGCQPAVLHGNTAVLVDQSHPASAGEGIEIYGTGLGPTTPVVAAGMPALANPLARTNTVPTVSIGGQPATVLFSGLAPGWAGLYQVNAAVLSGLRPGPQQVTWRIGNISSAGCGAIWVK